MHLWALCPCAQQLLQVQVGTAVAQAEAHAPVREAVHSYKMLSYEPPFCCSPDKITSMVHLRRLMQKVKLSSQVMGHVMGHQVMEVGL